MVYLITQWYGRSGNNFLQIINGIYYCLKHNIDRFDCISHNLFKQKLNLNGTNGQTITSTKELLLGEERLSLSKMKEIFRKYFKFNHTIPQLPYDIGIHIRSGDIFEMKNSHCQYMQPPLWFYKKIIEKNLDKSIVIIFENESNPIIGKLRELYKYKVCFQSSSLVNDIVTLASCKTLVFSNGTFCIVPYVVSDAIEHVIYPDFMQTDYNKWFKFDEENEKIDIPNYIDPYSWKYSPEQKEILLNYTCT